MVRRRSTVRFRNGAPAQRINSNLSNWLWEPFREPIGPGSSPGQDHVGIGPLWPAELCDPSPVLDPLDRAEDRRRGAADGPAHQVVRAVAVMYLGEPPVGGDEFAVRAGGHVAVGQRAGCARHADRHRQRGPELAGCLRTHPYGASSNRAPSTEHRAPSTEHRAAGGRRCAPDEPDPASRGTPADRRRTASTSASSSYPASNRVVRSATGHSRRWQPGRDWLASPPSNPEGSWTSRRSCCSSATPARASIRANTGVGSRSCCPGSFG
jgi:hypothetical protein